MARASSIHNRICLKCAVNVNHLSFGSWGNLLIHKWCTTFTLNIQTPDVAAKEWSGSKSQDPLLVHQSGHVSQFFDEGQFQVNREAGQVLASDLSTMVPRNEEEFSDDPCDWCAIDKRTNAVVLVSRIYNRFKDEACEEAANLLGISS